MHRFSLRQLTYFIACANARTLGEAAATLNISQGALSEALTALEAEFDRQLFVRRKAHGISLTPAGGELIAEALAVVSAADEFQAKAAGSGSILEGNIGIGCYTSLLPFMIPQLLEAFSRSYPRVTIELIEGSSEEISADLHRGRCDIAILYDFDLGPNTVHRAISQVSPCVLLPADHRLAGESSVDLGDLADELLLEFYVAPAPNTTQAIFDEIGVEHPASLKTQNFELIRCLVGRGLGYAVLLQNPQNRHSYEGYEIVSRPIRNVRTRFSVVLAQSALLKPAKRGEALLDFCLGVLQLVS